MIRIKELRTEKGLSQEELGAFLNIQKSAISKYERGALEPNKTMLIKMSELFNCSVDYLVGRSNQRNSINNEQQGHDEFMENVKIHFMDASEKDRDAIYRKISELYWDAKEKNDQSN